VQSSSSVVFAIAENGLSFVVFGTVAFSVVMSVVFLVTRGKDSMYDHIGQGGISREGDHGGGAAPLSAAADSPAAAVERELEVRQMLRARSERLQRQGQPALDIDAEVTRLLAPTTGASERDPGIVDEVRQLVIARNARRRRQGLDSLDVDAEIERTLRELDP
jgi:hypothetical protein